MHVLKFIELHKIKSKLYANFKTQPEVINADLHSHIKEV